MPGEKRKHERLDLTESVISKDTPVFEGLNVSLGGIRVVMGNKMEIGDVVEVEFNIPGNTNKFIAQGKVIWQEKSGKGYDTALEFINISIK